MHVGLHCNAKEKWATLLHQDISNLAPRLGGVNKNRSIIYARISFGYFICFVPPNILKMAYCYLKGIERGGGEVGQFLF